MKMYKLVQNRGTEEEPDVRVLDYTIKVEDLGELPFAVFSLAGHHGGGQYVAINTETLEAEFVLTTEWVETAEDRADLQAALTLVRETVSA